MWICQCATYLSSNIGYSYVYVIISSGSFILEIFVGKVFLWKRPFSGIFGSDIYVIFEDLISMKSDIYGNFGSDIYGTLHFVISGHKQSLSVWDWSSMSMSSDIYGNGS